MYHNILKSVIGKQTNNSMPPLIDQDGTPIVDDSDKATILNNHFASQTRLDTHDLRMPEISIPVPPIPQLSQI